MSNRSTFVKVYTDLDDHPAWMELDPQHLGLWLKALLYCRRNLTDGHFPARAVRRWGGDDLETSALTDAGRWHASGHQCKDCPNPEAGSLYLHGFLDHQNSKAAVDELSAKRAQAGARGGAARAQNKQSAKQSPGKAEAKTKPGLAEGEGEGENTPAARAATGAADFDKFWTLYPRKVGKGAAEKAFAKALKSTPVETIAAGLVNAVQVWRATGTEAKFIPHPSTWLNEGRWADEVPLPDMPTDSRPRLTLAQCLTPEQCPGTRHEWSDARGANRFLCVGDE